MPLEFFLEDLIHALKKKKMHLLFKRFALKCRRAFSSYFLAFYHPHLWRTRARVCFASGSRLEYLRTPSIRGTVIYLTEK